MITCPHCGFQAPDGSPYCPNCGYGKPLPSSVPVVLPQQPEQYRTIVCPRCGYQAPYGSPYCPNCGYGKPIIPPPSYLPIQPQPPAYRLVSMMPENIKTPADLTGEKPLEQIDQTNLHPNAEEPPTSGIIQPDPISKTEDGEWFSNRDCSFTDVTQTCAKPEIILSGTGNSETSDILYQSNSSHNAQNFDSEIRSANISDQIISNMSIDVPTISTAKNSDTDKAKPDSSNYSSSSSSNGCSCSTIIIFIILFSFLISKCGSSGTSSTSTYSSGSYRQYDNVVDYMKDEDPELWNIIEDRWNTMTGQ